jgi:hypothetical protein
MFGIVNTTFNVWSIKHGETIKYLIKDLKRKTKNKIFT